MLIKTTFLLSNAKSILFEIVSANHNSCNQDIQYVGLWNKIIWTGNVIWYTRNPIILTSSRSVHHWKRIINVESWFRACKLLLVILYVWNNRLTFSELLNFSKRNLHLTLIIQSVYYFAYKMITITRKNVIFDLNNINSSHVIAVQTLSYFELLDILYPDKLFLYTWR